MGKTFGTGKKASTGVNFGPNMKEHEIKLSKACNGGPLRLRLIGEVQPAYRYWVTTTTGDKRTVITPYFDQEAEEWVKGDPLASYPDARKEFYYTINCIDRADQKMKILLLKASIYNYLHSLAQNPDYGNPADPEHGYDIIITKESTGPLPKNVKYTVTPGRNNTPLTEEEKKMELFNLEEAYAPLSKEDYERWIVENTYALVNQANTTANTGAANEQVSTLLEDDIPF